MSRNIFEADVRPPDSSTVADMMREMGVLSQIQILCEWSEISEKLIVLGNDGSSVNGDNLESFVIHFLNAAKELKSRVLAIPKIAAGSVDQIITALDDVLSEYERLSTQISKDKITKSAIVGVMSDHASTPRAVVNAVNPKAQFCGCGMHKGTNVCEAVCGALNNVRPQEGIIDFINAITKLIVSSPKPYSKYSWWKSFLENPEIEFEGKFQREIGSRYFAKPFNCTTLLHNWNTVMQFFSKMAEAHPEPNKLLQKVIDLHNSHKRELFLECWILARLYEELFLPFFYIKSNSGTKANYLDANKFFESIVEGWTTLEKEPKKLFSMWGECWPSHAKTEYSNCGFVKTLQECIGFSKDEIKHLEEQITKLANVGKTSMQSFVEKNKGENADSVLKRTPATNDDVESSFGHYKSILAHRPNMGHDAICSLIMFKRNGTFQWLKSLDAEMRENFIEIAKKMRQPNRELKRKRNADLHQKKNDLLTEKQEKTVRTMAKRVARIQKLQGISLVTNPETLKTFTLEKLKDQARAIKHAFELKDWPWSKFSRRQELLAELVRKLAELSKSSTCPCNNPFHDEDTPILCECGAWNHLECIIFNLPQNALPNRTRYCGHCTTTTDFDEEPMLL